ncbi:hypothetical protein ABK040_005953 [Willaertia magna]
MSFLDQVIPLPYAKDALAPHISQETIEFHYEKHHKGYATKLNELSQTETALQGKTVEEILLNFKGKAFNLAAQVWNHNFYWQSLSPNGGGQPTGKLAEAINKTYGSFDKFKAEFNAQAVNHFGSGWVWLVREKDTNDVKVVSTHDGANPLTDNLYPLLTCDVWEHAFYIDYRNNKASYMDHFWNVVNWQLAESRLL